MNITFEERQLMSLYNTGTRTGLSRRWRKCAATSLRMKRSCGS